MRKLKGHSDGSVAKVISVQEDLYLDPQNPYKSWRWCHVSVIPMLEGRNHGALGACWSTRLIEMAASDSMRQDVSRSKVEKN